jgi:hypothetical protein
LPKPELSPWAWGPEDVNDAEHDSQIGGLDGGRTFVAHSSAHSSANDGSADDGSAYYEPAHDESAYYESADDGSAYYGSAHGLPAYDVFAYDGGPNLNIFDDWFALG